ncbi:hypothetical protein [Methanobrevibacter ruminantium]|uniref:hypothetical protein n=1 Tax=Methanobrevibacter ruminantium TaxID=83816 RepID=UPI0026EFC453|nr:hypothetical protein [Methanobrevibacter ruminantium]
MFFRSKAIGQSMDLFIVEGDEILYTDKTDYSFGDIILYKSSKNDNLICHRYFFRIGSYYIVAGDNNTYFEIVKKDNLVGKGIILIRTDRKRYDIGRKNDYRTKYCKFLFKCIIIGFISRKFTIFNRYYQKNNLLRNKLQVKYIDYCSL